jgi:hypothetical protein
MSSNAGRLKRKRSKPLPLTEKHYHAVQFYKDETSLAATYDFALLCGYAVGHFYKETRDPRYQDVVQQHSHVMPAST